MKEVQRLPKEYFCPARVLIAAIGVSLGALACSPGIVLESGQASLLPTLTPTPTPLPTVTETPPPTLEPTTTPSPTKTAGGILLDYLDQQLVDSRYSKSPTLKDFFREEGVEVSGGCLDRGVLAVTPSISHLAPYRYPVAHPLTQLKEDLNPEENETRSSCYAYSQTATDKWFWLALANGSWDNWSFYRLAHMGLAYNNFEFIREVRFDLDAPSRFKS